MATLKERLNTASPSDIADALRTVPIGDLIEGLVPSLKTETVTSGTVHVAPDQGTIHTVSTAGAALVIVDGTVTPAAGEVSVNYDIAAGPTLTFNAAVTTYTYSQTVIPRLLGLVLNTPAYVP